MDVVVSPELLARIRTEVSKTLPGAKSSHRAEALAAALGFSTNAALRDWNGSPPAHREVMLRPLSGAAFADRIEALAGTSFPDAAMAIEQAARAAGAAVIGPTYDEAEESGRNKFFEGGRNWYSPGISNVERLAYMSFLLRWRMLMSGSIRQFVEDYGKFHGDAHMNLAGCFQQSVDHDPLISGFLVDVLMTAHVDDGSDLGWSDRIYETFRNRINVYIDAVIRTWNPEVDPKAILPVTQPARRGRMLDRVVVSLSTVRVADDDVALSFHDAGLGQPTPEDLPGLLLMPHWRNGASHEQLEPYSDVPMGELTDLGRVLTVRNALMTPAEGMAALRPKHPLSELDESRDWSTVSVILVTGLDGPRASSLMRAAGMSVCDMDGTADDAKARAMSSMHFNDAVRIDGANVSMLKTIESLAAVGVPVVLADASDDLVASLWGIEGLIDVRGEKAPRP